MSDFTRRDVHCLKIFPQFFREVRTGQKTFEIRETRERDFKTDDLVMLMEWDPVSEYFTQQQLLKKIGFVTDWEQKPGYVVFSLLEVE